MLLSDIFVHISPLSRRALVRSQVLRHTSTFSPVPPTSYRAISNHLSASYASGIYLKDGPPKPGSEENTRPSNPLGDPAQMEGMMEGMKKQMVMMVPQMVIMGWINFFFQGFVLSKADFYFLNSVFRF
jgi:hypothetical protein